ncbi:hypothetical protein GCM10010472_67900 [Pseudonocardia halophobica]|uniref:Anti-sigma factor antagonist n=1 Tax=Pseudonocardia halophobica TaxID=29401 RepID=A0A9W6NXH1_9PSEU|nr:STAS domain-containing protein [Pseudonocardia halophobica]GLL12641.1 hypothetical protein GCM10017577_37820 [Pseudonocardia halophobica]
MVQGPVKQSAVFFLVQEVAMPDVCADAPDGGGAGTGDPFVPHLTTAAEARGDAVVVHVTGEIDAETAAEFRDAVTRVLDGRLVVVVLIGVAFLGSAGLAALLGIRDRAVASGAVVRFVVGGNRVVIRPLAITGVARELELYDELGPALRDPAPGAA